MLFSRMSVAARLYLGFGMIVLLLVVLTVIAVVKVDRIDRALRANSEIYSQVQRNAINFRGSAHDRSIAVRDLVFAPTAEQREQEMARIAALSDFLCPVCAILDVLLKLPGVSSEVFPLYADIQRAESQAVATTRAILEQVRDGNPAAVDLLWSEAKPQYVQWLAAINRLIDFKEQHIQATNQSAMDEASGFLRAMFTALTLALMLSAAVAWGVARSLVRQLGLNPMRWLRWRRRWLPVICILCKAYHAHSQTACWHRWGHADQSGDCGGAGTTGFQCREPRG